MALKSLYEGLRESSPNNPEFWDWWPGALLDIGMPEAAAPLYIDSARSYIDIAAMKMEEEPLQSLQYFQKACNHLDIALLHLQNNTSDEQLCVTRTMKGMCESQIGGDPHE